MILSTDVFLPFITFPFLKFTYYYPYNSGSLPGGHVRTTFNQNKDKSQIRLDLNLLEKIIQINNELDEVDDINLQEKKISSKKKLQKGIMIFFTIIKFQIKHQIYF